MTEVSADFETGTNGNTIAITDAGSQTAFSVFIAGGSDTVTYDTTHIEKGSLSCKLITTGGNVTFYGWQVGSFGTVTEHYGRLYMYYPSLPSGGGFVFAQFSKNGVGRAARFDVNADGTIQLIDSPASGNIGTTATIATNQWIRVEWHVIHSATVGQMELKLFNSPESLSPTETKTSPANWNTLSDADEAFFGLVAAGGSGTYWMDEIIAGAAAYPGPVSGVPAPQVLSMQSHVFGHNMW